MASVTRQKKTAEYGTASKQILNLYLVTFIMVREKLSQSLLGSQT
jgi:hypothetical protein